MSHGKDAHSGGGGMEWLNAHLGGLIMPLGKRFEAFAERIMFFIVNDFVRRFATLYVAVFTPLVLIELLLHFVQL